MCFLTQNALKSKRYFFPGLEAGQINFNICNKEIMECSQKNLKRINFIITEQYFFTF